MRHMTTAVAVLGISIPCLLTPGAVAGQPATEAATSTVTAQSYVKYYFLYEGPDYVGNGYMLKVKYAGSTIYINDPGTSRCYTARKVATNTWKYRQPNASSEPGWKTGYARANSSRTRFKMDDQYNRATFKLTSAAKARTWLRLWQEVDPGFRWNDPPC